MLPRGRTHTYSSFWACAGEFTPFKATAKLRRTMAREYLLERQSTSLSFFMHLFYLYCFVVFFVLVTFYPRRRETQLQGRLRRPHCARAESSRLGDEDFPLLGGDGFPHFGNRVSPIIRRYSNDVALWGKRTFSYVSRERFRVSRRD